MSAHQTPPATQPGAAVGEVDDLVPALLAWEPERDDRVEPLLQAEASRRGAAQWYYEDVENVISFLLATLHTPPPVATATVVDAGDMRKLREATSVWLKQIGYPLHWPNGEVRAVIAAIGCVLAATPTPPAGDR